MSCTERNADRTLPTADHAARQEQVGNIATGDQQHQTGNDQQQAQPVFVSVPQAGHARAGRADRHAEFLGHLPVLVGEDAVIIEPLLDFCGDPGL